MENFKRYTMVIRRDPEGFATPALKVRQKGEVLKFDEVRELLQTGAQQPQLEMPCESDFMAWCGIQHYNLSEAASIYRYIARHIKQVR